MTYKQKKRGSQKFVAMTHAMLNHPRWRMLSPSARVVYLDLKRRYNGANNGQIWAPQRDVAETTGLTRPTVQRGFQELAKNGFLVVTEKGALGVSGTGRASRYRLTELASADRKSATFDYTKI